MKTKMKEKGNVSQKELKEKESKNEENTKLDGKEQRKVRDEI